MPLKINIIAAIACALIVGILAGAYLPITFPISFAHDGRRNMKQVSGGAPVARSVAHASRAESRPIQFSDRAADQIANRRNIVLAP